MLTTTGYQNQATDLTQNATAANQARLLLLINQSLRYLTQKYYFNTHPSKTTGVYTPL